MDKLLSRPPHQTSALREALFEMERCGCPSLSLVRAELESSTRLSAQATAAAQRAYIELCRQAQGLRQSDDNSRSTKQAKLAVRDVLLWRFFGLQCGLLDAHRVEDCLFFEAAASQSLDLVEMNSQLRNTHLKIQQRVLEALIKSSIWIKLVKSMRNFQAYDEDEEKAHIRWALQWAGCTFNPAEEDE
jgi:hypothetical protein